MIDILVAEKNRLGTAISAVRPRIEAHIAWLEQELNDVDEGLRQTLRSSPVWRDEGLTLCSGRQTQPTVMPAKADTQASVESFVPTTLNSYGLDSTPACLSLLVTDCPRCPTDPIIQHRRTAPERTWENVNRPLAIAIDGPVASGKTAVGRLVARRLGLRFLDTGSMYRAVTRVALDRCIDLNDGDALTALAERLDLRLSFAHGADRLTADGTDVTDGLRTPGVERGVSLVARVPGVRRSLVAQQRRMAADGPLVMAGRDIGTVVMPDAPVKVYLNASARVRATRRRGDLAAGGSEADERRVLEDLTRRDKIDSERSDSPLRPARDAVIMDTDDLRIEHVADKIVDLVECD